VLAALKSAAAEIKGKLPCCDDQWNAIKKGRMDYPPAPRIYEYFGSMPRAWTAAGADSKRISMHNQDWSADEIIYVEDHAGIEKLETIGRKLHRNYNAVRGQLRVLGITARANQGYMSAAEVAKEYKTSYHRVCTLLNTGVLPGHFDKVRNRWEVDGMQLDKYEAILRAPRMTYKTRPVDMGDYAQRYGIRRINGKRVEV
jgi:hypothetical protein